MMKHSNSLAVQTLVVAVIAVAGVSGCKKSTANPFPPSGAVAGWQKSSDTRTFEPKDLWQYIDGDSEQFIQAGVVSTSTSDYKYQGQLEAVVDVYTMADRTVRRQFLNADRRRTRKSVSLGDEGLQYAQSVSFRKGHYAGAHCCLRIFCLDPAGADGAGARCRGKPLIRSGRLSRCTNGRKAMKSRRDFLKGAATGAMVLGAESSLGFIRAMDHQDENGKSKVVIARDPLLHGTDGKLDEKRVGDLLDRAIASYTGRKRPVEAWKHIVLEGGGKDKVIGLKTNGLGGKGISTHAVLVFAIAERLQQAGVKPGNILIWDRNARDLQACGFTISTDPSPHSLFRL